MNRDDRKMKRQREGKLLADDQATEWWWSEAVVASAVTLVFRS